MFKFSKDFILVRVERKLKGSHNSNENHAEESLRIDCAPPENHNGLLVIIKVTVAMIVTMKYKNG